MLHSTQRDRTFRFLESLAINIPLAIALWWGIIAAVKAVLP